MKKTVFFLSIFIFLSGCSGKDKKSVVCIAPAGEFVPKYPHELLGMINSQIGFEIDKEDFFCKRKSGGLVGWAMVNRKQKDLIKEKLKTSKTLNVLQVAELTPELEKLFRNS